MTALTESPSSSAHQGAALGRSVMCAARDKGQVWSKEGTMRGQGASGSYDPQ